MHRTVVDFFMNYIESNPEYLKRFHYTACPDELVFATVLMSESDRLNIEKRNSLRYVVWHPNRPATSLPLILNESEFDDIVNSKSIFCRKVSLTESAKLLDLLDARIQKTLLEKTNNHDITR